jgi:hypothetical protein
MPWKECLVMDERLRFVARLLEGARPEFAILDLQFEISDFQNLAPQAGLSNQQPSG